MNTHSHKPAKNNCKPVLAIVSPRKDAYSETFIKAHRELLHADTRYYFGEKIPHYLEGRGPLVSSKLTHLIRQRVRRRLFYKKLSVEEISLADSLIQEKVQVVLAEFGITGAAILPVCQHLKIPLITYFYGYDATVTELTRKYENSYKKLFSYATYIGIQSHGIGKILMKIGCPKEKLVYSVCGPNEIFFSTQRTSPIKQNFIAVGRFVDKKAPYYLILAFRKVSEKFPTSKLIMVGTGELWETCRNLVNYFNLQDRVVLTGVMTPEQLREQYSQATAFVQHSITSTDGNMEGTPISMLEAAASGLPIISTMHAGIPEVFTNGKHGFLVAEHDVDAMALHMCTLLEQPTIARQMGERARERVYKHFTLKKHLDLMNQLVYETASSRNRTFTDV